MKVVRRIATSYYGRNRMHVFDVCAAAIAPVVAIALRDETLFRADVAGALAIYFGLSVAFSLLAFSYFRIGEGLSRYFTISDALTITKAAVLAVLMTAVFAFVLTRLDSVPRSIPLIHLLVLTGTIIGGRLFRRESYRLKNERRTANATTVENVLIIGTNRLAWFYIAFLVNFGQGRHRIVGFLDDESGSQGRTLHGYPVLGRCDALGKVADQAAIHGMPVNRVVVALEDSRPDSMMWDRVNAACQARSISLEYLPERLGLLNAQTIAPATAPSEDVKPQLSPIRSTGEFWAIKRAFDIVSASLGLIIAAPLFVLVALFVYLEAGSPVVFWQLRLGRDRQPLFVYKFRTLHALYDRKGELIAEARRLTVLGRVLRATRLDELPQLINVLKGEMSIIGPRPLLPIDQPAEGSIRLAIRPGLTGWAQVHGGQLVSIKDKNALDEWYVRNASISVDLHILLLTIRTVIFGDRWTAGKLDHVLATLESTQPVQ